MSWTGDLVAAIAQKLDDNSIGTWDPDGDTGTIYAGALPSDVDGIGITPYSLTNSGPSLISDVTQPVQFWLRGTLSFVDDTADSIFDLFNGARRVTLGTVFCPLIQLHSDAQMGVDSSGRYERAVNYDFWANRPNSNRPD